MEALQAILVGGAAQSSLLIAGLVVYAVRFTDRVVGGLAGFGAGAIIAAVAFDLVPDTVDLARWEITVWFLVGAFVYLVSDRIVEQRFGSGDDGGPLGIVVGSVVDGVPESIIFGLQIAAGQPLSIPFVAAVWVSNLPQALAPSAALARTWPKMRMVAMWALVVGACAVTAGVGYVVGAEFGWSGGRAAAVAGGGLLAMLTDSLMPYAFEKGGAWAGVWTVVGFALAMA